MLCTMHEELIINFVVVDRMPFEDFTLVSVTGVQCDASTDEQVIDVSSQSVEIISREESQLLKLESLAVPPGDDALTQSTKLAGSPDNGRLSEAFMTADFYIDESLPSSPATDTATRRKVCGVEMQEVLFCAIGDASYSTLYSLQYNVSSGITCFRGKSIISARHCS